MVTINLAGYAARTGMEILRLGTWGSYGIEQLKVLADEEWSQMNAVTATFVTPYTSTRVVVPESGTIDVPQEATARPLTIANAGRIVFAGVKDGVQCITNNIPFTVSDHAPVQGDAPTPTPSEWEQYAEQLKNVVDAAVPPTDTAGLVLHSGGNAAPNYWAKSSGVGGSSGVIVDEDSGKQYTSEIRIRDGHAVLIMTQKER